MISMKINDELVELLEAEAKDREMSVSALVRWIIKEYFKKRNNDK